MPSIDRLQVLVQSRSITASKCISKLARLRPPISHNHGLQVHLQTRSITDSKCISNSLDYGVQVYLQTRSITASKCISKLARSRPPSESPNSLNYGFKVRTITASKCISKLARSSISGAPWIALMHRLQPVQIYRV
jgi:hypothetical protein